MNLRLFYETTLEGDNSTVSASVEDDGSQTALVENINPPSAPVRPDWNTVIPEDLKQKEYFKNILASEDPGAELVKQFDNAQQLIGKRPSGRPADDASDDDWNKYIESVRPKTADEYEIKMPDYGDEKLNEVAKEYYDEEFIGKAKALAHKHGLPKREFNAFVAEYEGMNAERLKSSYEAELGAQKQLDTDFDALSKQHFGNDRDKAVQYGRDAMTKHAPPEVAKYAAQWSAETLIGIACIAKSYHEAYEKGDTFSTKVSNNSGDSVESLNARIYELMAKPGWRSGFEADSDAIRAEVRELTDRKVALESKK